MTDKLYAIDCSTGCSCCSEDNHTKGFYTSQEDADKRVKFFKDPDKTNNPLASQYANKGRYSVIEYSFEKISKNRIIVDNKVFPETQILKVKEDGTILENKEEQVWSGY